MKDILRKPVLWMAVMTCVFCTAVLKIQYDIEHEQPDRKFIALVNAMYAGETEYIRVYSEDDKDMTDSVLMAFEEEWREKDYQAIYEGFKDRYIIRYDTAGADLNMK